MKLFAAVAAALLLGGCGGGSSSGGDLVGAGSTFVYPLVAKWMQDYGSKRDARITYGPIGSGGGIQQLTNRTIDFAASDAPRSPDQSDRCDGCVQVPWALAATSIPYNVPGAPKHLRLTGQTLADIYLGEVTTWNDAAIARLNPGVELPSLRITPIYRRDSSGTTFNVTDYLAKVSPKWRSKVGVGTAVDFPTGTGATGSSGVAAALSGAKGGIAYVDAAYSIENGFSYAALRNRAGSFELPDRASVTAAAGAVARIPPDNAISIVDPPAAAANAYPLSTFTYAIVPVSTSKAVALQQFLAYAITDGQAFAPELQFADLPTKVVSAGKQTIRKIKPG